ncbi:MAG: hypothetical protein E4G90_04365 [Gemmatimonadales bacterium]|nr:MAG: hypothetical protein E4G90_04365 [Gemmatimonadales bacterium]
MRLASFTLLSLTVLGSMAMPLSAQTFDVSLPPGDNFDTAEFRLWHPEGVELLRGIVVLVPGFFFIGGADLEFRNDIIAGIFAINRRAGALWALAVEPGVGHEVAGYIADPKSMAIYPAADSPQTAYPTSWLPTETLARAWLKLVGGEISPRLQATPAPRLR